MITINITRVVVKPLLKIDLPIKKSFNNEQYKNKEKLTNLLSLCLSVCLSPALPLPLSLCLSVSLCLSLFFSLYCVNCIHIMMKRRERSMDLL